MKDDDAGCGLILVGIGFGSLFGAGVAAIVAGSILFVVCVWKVARKR